MFTSTFKAITSKTLTVLVLVSMLLVALPTAPASAASAAYTTPGANSWVAPTGVTSVTVEVWGGGGRGASILSSSSGPGGGGGGGAYSIKANIAVIPGSSYTAFVGAGSTSGATPGGDSYFIDASTVMAKGGGSVADNISTGTTGGQASAGVGDTKWNGGSGANGSGSNGGGGGSSAGTGANGTNATNQNGATAPSGGGNGGNGKTFTSGDGTAGSAPGGAGGGAYRQSGGTRNGGNGANGKVVITYKNSTTVAIVCTPGSVTIGSTTSCTVTVTRTGGSANVTGTVAWTITSADTGTFTTSPCTLSGSGASASCAVTYNPSAIGTGSHVIQAAYGGDTNYTGSSNTQTVPVANKNNTSVAIVCTPGSVNTGTPTSCTATVTRSAGSANVTGTVAWTIVSADTGTFTTSPCTLSGTGASASCTLTYTPTAVGTGSHVIRATYSGDANYNTSNNTQTVTVTTKNNTTVAIICTPASVNFGSSTSCTATVTRSAGSANVTGTVAWTIVSADTGTFATSPCTLSGSGASASCAVTYTPTAYGTGSHVIRATYSGDTNYNTSNNTQTIPIIVASTYTISGSVGLIGVTVNFSGGIPVTSGAGGAYTVTVPAFWTGTVTPSMTGWSFRPTSRSYTNVLANVTGQNFTPELPGTIYYVNKTNPACSDSGAGTSPSAPFCTIGKAANVAVAGNTVSVLAGSYAERVRPDNSGTADNPILYTAAAGVTVTGDPTVLAPSRSAFRFTNLSYITVEGFHVTGTLNEGIYVYGSNHITIKDNHVDHSGSPASGLDYGGIVFYNTTDSTIHGNTTDHNSSHGIQISGCSNLMVNNNTSFANAATYARRAIGIYVATASTNNTFLHNILYANEDSGLGFDDGPTNNIVVGNLIYGNGDHGIDQYNSTGNIIVGNTVQGNVTAGINLEGTTGSSGATLRNNIVVNNGINPPAPGLPGNINVSGLSQAGTTLDYNLYYQGSGSSVQIYWAGSYTSLSAFQSATGQEAHGLQANPLFVAPAPPATNPPAVNVGNYHLSTGSPAIDSANSAAPNWPSLDLDDHDRMDDPGTPNTGAGTRTYDDRGAYELQVATVTLGGLLQTYDGTPKPVTVTTDPPGLTVNVTYTPGGATAPTNANSYPVVATVNAINYTGSASGTLVIQKANQVINVTTHAPAGAVNGTSFTVAATGGTSGNPIVYSSSGGCTNVGATFTMTSDTLACAVMYDQAGNANYNVALRVTENTNSLGTPPVVITNPINLAVNSGATATFTAAASGFPTPTVQWQVSTDVGVTWNPIPGATTTTLSFTAASSDNGRQYRAVFTNTAGSATTTAATLTVNTAPVVSLNPAHLVVDAGTTATFTAAASGTPAPTVQWQVSTNAGLTWDDVPGAASPTFSFTAAAGENGFRYRAVFTNVAGSATTTAAIMTVNTASPVVSLNPVNLTVTAGTTASFTAAATGIPVPTVQWKVSTDVGLTWNNVPGATSTTLSFTAIAGDNGKQYLAVFTNGIGGPVTTTAATLTVHTIPAVSLHPANQTVLAGATATFTAAASGFPVPTVQWEISTDGGTIWTGIPGATTTSLSFITTAVENGYQYRAVFTNAAGSATTTAAILTVNSAPVVSLNPANLTVNAGATATFTAAASGTPTPTVQWKVSTDSGLNWNDVPGATSTTLSFITVAADNGHQYRAVFTNVVSSATTTAAILTVNSAPIVSLDPANLTVNAGATASFTAAASGFPAPTVQWQVSTNGGTIWNPIPGATFTTLSFTTAAIDNSNQYRAVFTNVVGSTPTAAAILTVNSPPVVSLHPANLTITAGATATFTAAASGFPVPTVQWKVSTDGGTTWNDVLGANNPTLSFITVAADNGRQYRAVFTNAAASVSTTVATLTVNSAPVVSLHPANLTVTAGATATFTAAASGFPNPTVQWQLSTNGGVAWNDIPGATTTTLSFTTVAGDNSYQYRAVFTNVVSTVPTAAAILTVHTPPAVSLHPANLTVTAGATATFTAAASGNPIPTVQWQVSTDGGTIWTNIPGATTTTLSFTTVAGDNAHQYRAVFTNVVSSATTTAATLTVNSAPAVSLNPANLAANAGATASFTAAASGFPVPTVQWQISTNGGTIWTDIPGATSTTLSFTAAPGDDGYKYRAIFTNTLGSATTTAATLTINKYTLTVSTIGSGNVTSDVGGINCGTGVACSAEYDYNTPVTLTAVSIGVGWSFIGWSGDVSCPGTGTCVVNMTADKSVTATFAYSEFTLTVTSAHGTVVKNPDREKYYEGEVVQLTVTPAVGWSFAGWSGGGLTGFDNPGNVTIHGNTAVTANYSLVPILMSPANGVTLLNRRPVLDWLDMAGATRYDIQVARNATFTLGLLRYTSTVSTFTPTSDLAAKTTYYWRVRAFGAFGLGGFSEVRSFKTGNPPSTPALVLPGSNALTIDYTPRLDWSNSTLPIGTLFQKYELQLATDSTFTAPTSVDIVGPATYSEHTPGADLTPNTIYYWRVRAYNMVGEYSSWSLVRKFRTALLPPTLSSPANGAILLNRRPTFSWGAVSGATSYTIRVYRNSALTLLVGSYSSTSATFTPTADLPANLTLWWRVQSKGLNGPSAWSAPFSIHTANPPSIPVLVSPANNALTTDYTPRLDWSNSTLPIGTLFQKYELQLATDSAFTAPSSMYVAGPVTNSEYTPGVDLNPNTIYYWRMRAYNMVGEYSSWSLVRKFRTAITSPVLLTPTDGATTTNRKPIFDWGDVTGATNYTIQVSRNSTFTSLVVNATVIPSTYTPTINLPVGTLYWRVKANGVNGPSLWAVRFTLIEQ